MEIYLAGENGKSRILAEISKKGGGEMMDIYLAGGISGNLFPLWKKQAIKRGEGQKILESFYYCRDNMVIQKLIPTLSGFMLDSGGFSFMQGRAVVDWDAYIEEYADFINTYKIELFFELDIDSVVGLKAVEKLRAKLERLTGKQPIPVWHKSRGKDYFIRMSKNYPYVALGGIVSREIPRATYEAAFPWFIQIAHENGAKIHGLGYTNIPGLKKYHFDSVDSTAWLYGNRGGYLYHFNAKAGIMEQIHAPAGYRLKSQDAAIWNFKEWNKFQSYAERYL